MDALEIARWQFGITTVYHFMMVPLTIGLGLVVAVVVHSAGIQDRDGARLLFERAARHGFFPRMSRVWADGGYAGKLIGWPGVS